MGMLVKVVKVDTLDVRRDQRIAVREAGKIIAEDREAVSVEVMDISRDGVRCDGPVDVSTGDEVMIELGRLGWKRAVVKWMLAPSIGFQFFGKLDDYVLAEAFFNDPMPRGMSATQAIA